MIPLQCRESSETLSGCARYVIGHSCMQRGKLKSCCVPGAFLGAGKATSNREWGKKKRRSSRARLDDDRSRQAYQEAARRQIDS